MFDGLLKPKFYTKCKSTVKNTRIRLDSVKNRKRSVCKYFKNDIADLLRSGHDYNAYGRIEGFLEEKKRLSCYGHIEQFCACVLRSLSLMLKQGECPEECREGVSSLIYAAARVSEIPELRDLRAVFTERYGNSIDAYVNHEFAETFESMPPSRERKIQLMHDIAQEFSIRWDSKGLEQKLLRQTSSLQTEPSYQSLSGTGDGRCKKQMNKNNNGSQDERLRKEKGSDTDDDPYKRRNNYGFENTEEKETRREYPVGKDKGNETGADPCIRQKFTKSSSENIIESQDSRKDYNVTNKKLGELQFYRRKDIADAKNKKHSSSEDKPFSIRTKDSVDRDSFWASSSSSVGSVSEDEENIISNSKKPSSYGFIPPPYTKTDNEKQERHIEKTKKPNDGAEIEAKQKPRSVRQRFLKPQPGYEGTKAK